MSTPQGTLLQRVTTRPLPASLPQDRDIPFPAYAAYLPTPPAYFLTYSAAPVDPRIGFIPPFTWSIPYDDLMLVFLSLTFALARSDHPDEAIIFLFYVWADESAQARLSRDPRLRNPSWSSFCALLRDAFPEIARTVPDITMHYLSVLDMLLHDRPCTAGSVRIIMQRFAVIFHISAEIDIIHIRALPEHFDHPHQDAATLLLRNGTPANLAALHHAESVSSTLFNLVLRLHSLVGLPARIGVASQIPMILDHILFMNDQLDQLRHELLIVQGLLVRAPDGPPAAPEPAPVIDLTRDH